MDIVAEAPFSPISDSAHQNNIKKIENSDIVIITRVTIGYGNLKNMIAAQIAISAGAKIIVFEDFNGMDYTNGKATEIYNDLIDNGAIVVKDETELFNILTSMDM